MNQSARTVFEAQKGNANEPLEHLDSQESHSFNVTYRNPES